MTFLLPHKYVRPQSHCSEIVEEVSRNHQISEGRIGRETLVSVQFQVGAAALQEEEGRYEVVEVDNKDLPTLCKAGMIRRFGAQYPSKQQFVAGRRIASTRQPTNVGVDVVAR